MTNDTNSKIILISDLLQAKSHREEELAFYSYQLEVLQKKLASIRHEINLTNHIIELIKNEKLEEIIPKNRRDN